MARRRFSIAAMMGLIFLLGAIFAGVRSGSNDSFKLIYSALFLMLVYAAIASRWREAFWYGFAVAGWAYYLVGFGPWIGMTGSSATPGAVNRNLVSSVVIEIVSGTIASYDPPPLEGNSMMAAQIFELRQANRSGVIHCALTVLFAFIGGLVSRAMATRTTENHLNLQN